MSVIDRIMKEIGDYAKDGVLEFKEAAEKGRPTVGTYCTFAPWELISASGAIVTTLCATGNDTIPAAEEHLPRNLCPLIKSSYGYALTDRCPYFHFCDMIIAETTCDGKKKMYELLSKLKEMHILKLPQSSGGEADLEAWKRELLTLKQTLETRFCVEITEEKLRRQIRLRNGERKALAEIWELSKLDPPALTGGDLNAISEYCEFHFDKENLIPWIRRTAGAIREAYDAGERRVPPKKQPRILVTGCPIGGAKKVIDIVEESGGVVVCYENCGGVKELGFLVDEDRDPMDALTDKYLNIGCSVMTPNRNRMENLSRMLDEYRVDGVLEVILQACHTYAVETHSVKELVRSKGRPYLAIETDYSQSDTGQLSTRISAFLEMM